MPVPAFVLFVWLCWRDERLRVRLRRLAVAGALFVAVALCWMVFVSLSPAHDQPYAIGSTNGSVWNSVFVFDGWDRIVKPAAPKSFSTRSAALPAAHAAAAHTAAASHTADATGRRRDHGIVGSRDRIQDRTPAPVPVQPGRLRHPARDAAVRGDRVRARRACAAGAPPAAGAPTGGPPAADRMGGHPRAHALAADRLPALQLLRAHAAALSGGLHARCRDRARRCVARRGCPRARSVRHLRPARHVRDRHGGGRRGDGQRQARLPRDHDRRRSGRARRARMSDSRFCAVFDCAAGRRGTRPCASPPGCWGRCLPCRPCATSC